MTNTCRPPGRWPDDVFFRHIVSGMRNGVLAITRDGRIALMNDEAYRIFGLEPKRDDLGRPFADVLRDHVDLVRVLSSVFDVDLLPNRVELRLKPSGMVIGYTLAHVLSDEGDVIGAAISGLPAMQAEVIRLRDALGWSSEEVRNALDLTETNQRVLLHRARAKVRGALERYFSSEAK